MAKDKNTNNTQVILAPTPKNGQATVVELTVVDGRLQPDTHPGVKQ